MELDLDLSSRLRPPADPTKPIGSNDHGIPGWIVGLLPTFTGEVQVVAAYFARAEHWNGPQSVAAVAAELELEAGHAAASVATLQICGLVKRVRGIRKSKDAPDSRLRQQYECVGSFKVQCAVQALLDQHRAQDHVWHEEVLSGHAWDDPLADVFLDGMTLKFDGAGFDHLSEAYSYPPLRAKLDRLLDDLGWMAEDENIWSTTLVER